MRIIEISSATEIGGGEIHLVELVKELASRGHFISLVVRPGSPIPSRLDNASVDVRAFRLRNAADMVSVWQIAQLVREREIDVIHAHLGRDYPLAAMAALLAQRPALVLTRHHYLPLWHHSLYRRLLSRVDRFIAVSESVRETIAESVGIDKNRIAVIPNWIPHSGGSPALDSQAARRKWEIRAPLAVGMLASIEPAKGVLEFVRASRLLLEKAIDAEFIIGGRTDPAHQAYLEEVEKAAGIWRDRQRVRFLGEIDCPAEFLSGLDVVVVPSWKEAFSLVTVEGMAHGKAVVATRSGGPAEIIDEGITGLLVPPQDAASLAEAIETVLKDQPLRRRMGEQARKTALERYQRSKIVDQVEDLFRDVCRIRAPQH